MHKNIGLNMVKCDILWDNLNYPLVLHDYQTLSNINKQLRKLRVTNGLQLQGLGFVHLYNFLRAISVSLILEAFTVNLYVEQLFTQRI